MFLKWLSYWINSIFFKHLNKTITVTYYIPSPPNRSTGYREKEFDKFVNKFISDGFQIISVNTQANTGADSSGMWVIFTLKPLKSSALKTINEDLSGRPEGSEQLEDIYTVSS